jgi:hypothetical protein
MSAEICPFVDFQSSAPCRIPKRNFALDRGLARQVAVCKTPLPVNVACSEPSASPSEI